MTSYWKSHPEKRSEQRKAWRKRNRILFPEKWAAEIKARRNADLELSRRKESRYRKDNPEAQRRAFKKYMATHPMARLAWRIRTRTYLVLKGFSKAASTFVLLGCNREQLRAHFESLFVPGMTWENYGPVWHVDHIRPCASFDLTQPEQQKQCFHFSNLQPLFAADNLKKGAKWI